MNQQAEVTLFCSEVSDKLSGPIGTYFSIGVHVKTARLVQTEFKAISYKRNQMIKTGFAD